MSARSEQSHDIQQRAVADVLDLLGMANYAAHRACAQLSGAGAKTALSIAVQLDALRERAQELARLLENEERRNDEVVSDGSRKAQGRRRTDSPASHGALASP
jgi:hypothetical protein